MECFILMSSKLPRLRDLTLYKGLPPLKEFHLPYQHDVIIKDIVPKVPEIRRVKLTRGICWRRTDCWQPIIPLDGRKDLRRRLVKCYVDHVVDFGNLFASFFRPEELSDGLRSKIFPDRER
jgi:hypothetical protein